MSAQDRAHHADTTTTWCDWKGDLVPEFGANFGNLDRVVIPKEFENETAIVAYLGTSSREMRTIWHHRGRMYQHFSIAKGLRKVRMISAPDERLKMLQRKIADRLNAVYRPRNSVHGFIVGRSVKTNALSHMHRRFTVNIDLKDFFPTITENRVKGLIKSFGIDSRVCDIIARICCNNDQLPQDAPSSPVISNMICFRLDKKLLSVAKDARCIYTRYADDITFSSYQPPAALFEASMPPPGRFAPTMLAPKLRQSVLDNGFAINTEKAHYADRHSRRMVTGLKINELLNVDRRYVRNIRAAIHSVEKFGVQEAEKKFRDEHGGRSNLAAHLQGKISFLTYIKGRSDPVVRAIRLRFNNSFPNNLISVVPTSSEIQDRSVWVVDVEVNGEELCRQGSAFFLKDVGLVTAAHCVENASKVEIYHPSKPANKFIAHVLKTCPHRDLAVIQHNIPTVEYFELTRSQHVTVQGDYVTAVGYPEYGPGDRSNARPGAVSALTMKGGVAKVEVTQALTPGMSGGPVIYGDGGVVGIIHKGEPGGRNFAVDIKVLNAWLEEAQ